MRVCLTSALSAALLMFAGCGKSPPAVPDSPAPTSSVAATPAASAEPAVAATPAITEVKKIDATGFTLGEYLPPLDGGRIEIAPPAEWQPLPRDSKYLVRFYKDSRNGLPRLDVAVDEESELGINDVTEANVADFTAAVAREMESGGTTLIESPVPMIIGTLPCARIVSKLKLKIGAGTIVVERQTLAVLHAGRLYKINLLVETNKLAASKDAAYAVCSGLRFPAVETPGS